MPPQQDPEVLASNETTVNGFVCDAEPSKTSTMKPTLASSKADIPSVSTSAVLKESATLPDSTPKCKGVDFSSKSSSENVLDQILESFKTTGFQATNIALAVDQIKEMRKWRLSDVEWSEGDDVALKPLQVRKQLRARIFLGYTSNQISSGNREVIKFLVQNKMVDCLITTAGGIEEDIIKCFQPTFMGDFNLKGSALREKGINRIGNLLVPNNNYCEFETWLSPLLEEMHKEQDAKWLEWAKTIVNKQEGDEHTLEKFVWTPSKFIHRMGKEIDNEESVLYWAAKNDIPVFCPALTDGSIGDMLHFHSFKSPGFVLDISEDIHRINDISVHSHASGMILLGGGLAKHHTCNANMMRNGADFSVYINTGQEFDGSDSGAAPDEAVSWGKIKSTAKPVKVNCDATIAFPLIVSQTFAKNVDEWKEEMKGTACYLDDL